MKKLIPLLVLAVGICLLITAVVNLIMCMQLSKRIANQERQYANYVLHDIQIRIMKYIKELAEVTGAISDHTVGKTNRGIERLELIKKLKILDREKCKKENVKSKIEGFVSPMSLLKADISFDNETWETSGRKGLKNWQVKSSVTEKTDHLSIYVKIEYREAPN